MQEKYSVQKNREPIGSLRYGIRRRPMLPGRVQPSTFGTERLNFCVRDGNRWDPLVIATGNGELFSCGGWLSFAHDSRPAFACRSSPVGSPCACFPLASTRFPLLPLGSPRFRFLPLALPRSLPHPDNCTAMILTDRFQLVSLSWTLR